MKELFKNIIHDFIVKDLSAVNDRDYEIPFDISKIITIIGARRTGKTYLLFSIIKNLRKTINSENLIYINFEDDRLFPLKLEHLNSFIEAYYELYPDKKKEKVYFFFDEVQQVENWELFIRRIYDNEKCRIYITGSSSKLLSKEIASSLRGRTLSYSIFPYSFKEYLLYNNIKTDFYSSAGKAKLLNYFNKYTSSTSFPELVDFDTSTQIKALHDYFDLIIYKDLIERFKISNHFLIKYFVKFLLNNISNPISINKCFNDFKSQGIQVSKTNLFQYLDYISDAFIVYPINMYTENMREKNRNPSKIYSLDIGLNSLFSQKINIGRIFENIVFLELRRSNTEIFYYKNKQEVDFLVNTAKGIKLINVAYSISETETRKREINGLCSAMDALNLKEAFLITNDKEELVSVKNKKIHIIPLWKWLI